MDPLAVRISISIPLAHTWFKVFCRKVLWILLCRILVLSGSSCGPTLPASMLRSLSIAVICGREVDNNRMSSANLKLVIVRLSSGCVFMPHLLICHFGKAKQGFIHTIE